jgi:hypothetical protein
MIILTGDEDEIGSELLKWSGLDQVWDDNELSHDHSPLHDLLYVCSSLDFDREEFLADRPGASGSFFKVIIKNEHAAKDELTWLVYGVIAS